MVLQLARRCSSDPEPVRDSDHDRDPDNDSANNCDAGKDGAGGSAASHSSGSE